jgi:hypothetical protein
MTAKELQQRNERASQLRVLQIDDTSFFVESSDGKILYRVIATEDEVQCTCGDFARGCKTDPNFTCKHIIAVRQCVPNGDAKAVEYLERRKPRLDERFIMELEGREFVKFSGLLDLGHQKGILKVEVEPLQFPTKENEHMAICKAVISSKAGETFSDIGDANPQNCNSRVSKHLLRMASTRAIARALRCFTNIGMTCLEELGSFEEVIGADIPADVKLGRRPVVVETKKDNPKPRQEKPGAKTAKPRLAANPEKSDIAKDNPGTQTSSVSAAGAPDKGNGKDKSEAGTGEQPTISEAQKRAVLNLSRRRNISVEELEKMAKDKYGVAVDTLTADDARNFIRQLQQAA